jgi:erythronate-4-phosphate dehydrogenase
MRIVVDRNIPLAASAFRDLGEVVLVDTPDISRTVVKDAEILVIRSETKVDRALLEGSRVRFVGTATTGTDHIDLSYLESQGIGFANAPGSNANSVKEYVLAALLVLSRREGFTLRGKTLGVVGVGNIGARVVKMASALGLNVLQNDPPLARETGQPQFHPLDDLMSADIITLHVPLTRGGEDATYHLFDERRIAAMKPGAILINTARGAVVDTGALKEALRHGHLSAAVADVWENEPSIDGELLQLVALGTAHIAGYSMDGKVNAVRMVRQAVCRFLSVESTWDPWKELPPPEITHIHLNGSGSFEDLLHAAVRWCYDIELDDQYLRAMVDIPAETRARYFMKLRSSYRVRREFSSVRVEVAAGSEAIREAMHAVGFLVDGDRKGFPCND